MGYFDPYKSAGSHGITPIMQQKPLERIIKPFTGIFRGWSSLEYEPDNWKEPRAVFISKAGKSSRKRINRSTEKTAPRLGSRSSELIRKE